MWRQQFKALAAPGWIHGVNANCSKCMYCGQVPHEYIKNALAKYEDRQGHISLLNQGICLKHELLDLSTICYHLRKSNLNVVIAFSGIVNFVVSRDTLDSEKWSFYCDLCESISLGMFWCCSLFSNWSPTWRRVTNINHYTTIQHLF